ncbi:MazG nucleotide pyrophosphohydrolase domain-containing protein [Deinococcus yavapaiensis]|uniref:Putative HAD superfamily Cof-like phosphohydrolase n=1 Tax=Deinococcus yavapaiensis KR-236 TaxID=694435 RepID=A0A318SBQ4_9DEIO|nr:MazG nucleotide pyrophosphohydrolase domain-containing protein [Deinococcus yavapaiensis]PYE54177.1 putative HAD superfamily Cof-like phosphohydrolase [Deinococcus yavapaiensis KR-236]
MTTNADKVRAFHEAIGAAFPDRPSFPSPELLSLRRTLIREEYEEVMEAMDSLSDDLAPLAQELADLLYVTYGAMLALGLDANAVFAEVHRANMEKTKGPKRADGKQLKPEGWRPADVRGVLKRLGANNST